MKASKKVSPKQAVANKVHELFGGGRHVEVRGTRVRGRFGGYFIAECNIDDVTIARARHRDWRVAYKFLDVEVEKVFEQGIALV
jgi:hypothetical protein